MDLTSGFHEEKVFLLLFSFILFCGMKNGLVNGYRRKINGNIRG